MASHRPDVSAYLRLLSKAHPALRVVRRRRSGPREIRPRSLPAIVMFFVLVGIPSAGMARTAAPTAAIDGPDAAVVAGAMDGLVTQPVGNGVIRVTADAAGHRLTGGRVREVSVGPDGTVWVARGPDAFALNEAGRIRARYIGAGSYPRRLDQAPSGVLWAVEEDGTVIAHEGQGWSDRSNGERAVVRSLSLLDDGTVWSVLRSGDGPDRIARLDPMGWTIFEAGLDLLTGGKGTAYSFARGHDGKVWLGVDAGRYGGLAVFDGVTWREVESLGSLVAPRVLNLTVAADGTLWVLSDLNTMVHAVDRQRYRLARFDGAGWTIYSPGDGLTSDRPAASPGLQTFLPAPMVATADGTLWFSLDGLGLVAFDGDTFTRRETPALKLGALDLDVDRDDRIWVAGWRGALYYIEPVPQALPHPAAATLPPPQRVTPAVWCPQACPR